MAMVFAAVRLATLAASPFAVRRLGFPAKFALPILSAEFAAQLLLLFCIYSLPALWLLFGASACCFAAAGLAARLPFTQACLSLALAALLAFGRDWALWAPNAPTTAVLALGIQQFGAAFCLFSWMQACRRQTAPWVILWCCGAMLPPLAWLSDSWSLLEGLQWRGVWDVAWTTVLLGLTQRRKQP